MGLYPSLHDCPGPWPLPVLVKHWSQQRHNPEQDAAGIGLSDHKKLQIHSAFAD